MRVVFKRRATLITEKLNNISGISCQLPGGAFYAFPNITGLGLASEDIQTILLEDYGVAGLAGTAFGRKRFLPDQQLRNLQEGWFVYLLRQAQDL